MNRIPATPDHIGAVLGGTATIADGTLLLDGNPLTESQQSAIAPLLDNGVPDTVDADAVRFETSRRINALIPRHERELMQANAIAALAAEINSLRSAWGDSSVPPPTAEFIEALGDLSSVVQVAAIKAAEAAVLSGALPADYGALVARFDAEMAQ